jgi:hypothetical protein
MELTAIIAICKTALDAGSEAITIGGQVYAAIRARRFSEREKELLVHASRKGDFCYLRTSRHGHWVRAGTKDLFDRADRAHQAHYIDAFVSLCQRGIVRHEGGRLFRLTGVGFDKARNFATRMRRRRVTPNQLGNLNRNLNRLRKAKQL